MSIEANLALIKWQHIVTGDIFELPPPDILGRSFILLNGEIVMRLTYKDSDIVELEDGRIFNGAAFCDWVLEQLKTGAWRHQA